MLLMEHWGNNGYITKEKEWLIKAVAERCVHETESMYSRTTEASIYFTDDIKMRELNMQYRDIDDTTDVLSFPMNEFGSEEIGADMPEINPETGNILLGDIIISVDRCLTQAEEYGHSFERELAFLVAHGMLHLLGYDHIDSKDEIEMIKAQNTILEDVGVKR